MWLEAVVVLVWCFLVKSQLSGFDLQPNKGFESDAYGVGSTLSQCELKGVCVVVCPVFFSTGFVKTVLKSQQCLRGKRQKSKARNPAKDEKAILPRLPGPKLVKTRSLMQIILMFTCTFSLTRISTG